jgi:hypothetical protein
MRLRAGEIAGAKNMPIEIPKSGLTPGASAVVERYVGANIKAESWIARGGYWVAALVALLVVADGPDRQRSGAHRKLERGPPLYGDHARHRELGVFSRLGLAVVMEWPDRSSFRQKEICGPGAAGKRTAEDHRNIQPHALKAYWIAP